MFRMLVLSHQACHHFSSRRTDALAPVSQPGRRPFLVSAVGGGHVRGRRGEPTLAAITGMAGQALSSVHQLHHRRGDACFERLPDERMGTL